MATHQLPLTGSCLCGSVTVSLAVLPILTVACHCHDCQKLTASAFSMTSMFPADSFECAGDVIRGGHGSGGRAHWYCKSCLTFVWSQVESAQHRVNLRTSILDSAASFPPFVEVMTDEKVPWSSVPAPHSYGRAPETVQDLQTLMDGYADWR